MSSPAAAPPPPPSASSLSPASPSPASSVVVQPTRPRIPSARRAGLTAVACEPCRRRKSKCDGARPICNTCVAKQTVSCVYDVGAERRRPALLRQGIRELEQEVNRLRAVIALIAASPEGDAGPAIARTVQEHGRTTSALPGPMQGAIDADVHPDVASSLLPSPVKTEEPWSSCSSSDDAQSLRDDGAEQDSPPEARVMRDGGTERSSPHAAAVLGLGLLAGGTDHRRARQRSQLGSRPPSRPAAARHVNAFGHLPLSASIRTNGHPTPIQDAQVAHLSLPIYAVQPLNHEDYRPLGRLFSDVYVRYRTEARRLLAEGWPVAQVLGPDEMDVKAVLQPTAPNGLHRTLAKFAAGVMMTFVEMGFPEKLGCIMLIMELTRWQILPNEENYKKMPAWLRPTPTQIFVPHGASIDSVPWPKIRDALSTCAEDHIAAVAGTVSVNWPYADEDTYLLDERTGEVRLNPIFEAHIRDLTNWLLGPTALEVFPNFEGKVRIKD